MYPNRRKVLSTGLNTQIEMLCSKHVRTCLLKGCSTYEIQFKILYPEILMDILKHSKRLWRYAYEGGTRERNITR